MSSTATISSRRCSKIKRVLKMVRKKSNVLLKTERRTPSPASLNVTSSLLRRPRGAANGGSKMLPMNEGLEWLPAGSSWIRVSFKPRALAPSMLYCGETSSEFVIEFHWRIHPPAECRNTRNERNFYERNRSEWNGRQTLMKWRWNGDEMAVKWQWNGDEWKSKRTENRKQFPLGVVGS